MASKKKDFSEMTFDDFRKVDVTSYCDVRDGIKYLNWAKCKQLLHDLGAKNVYFEPVVLANGSSLIQSDSVFIDKDKKTNRCYEVRVKIVVDDLSFESQFPVMNGANPVKDNSMSQQRVWNAQTRAFVKGVAIRLGLGFDLWLSDYESNAEEDLSKHSLEKIRQRFQEEYTDKLRKGISVADIAEKLNMTKGEVEAVFAQFDTLIKFEENLKQVTK